MTETKRKVELKNGWIGWAFYKDNEKEPYAFSCFWNKNNEIVYTGHKFFSIVLPQDIKRYII